MLAIEKSAHCSALRIHDPLHNGFVQIDQGLRDERGLGNLSGHSGRRIAVFGSVEGLGRGGAAILQARADPTGSARFLAALDARHATTGQQVILVLDNGSCHTSRASQQACAQRAAWLEVIRLARYHPELNPIEREWCLLRRDQCSHLAERLRAFVDAAVAGLQRLGGERCDIIDEVPNDESMAINANRQNTPPQELTSTYLERRTPRHNRRIRHP